MTRPPEHGLVVQRAIRVRATPARVMAAFFDPDDLTAWWEVSRSVTLARPLGPFAVQWSPADFIDEVLGRLGGTLHGTVMDYEPEVSCLLADLYWQPPSGDPVGPMALSIEARPTGDGWTTEVAIRQSADENGPRWERYFHVMAGVWDRALLALKTHLER
ncbi:MAG TPA: SRPBCC domain-containing protein [Vicinamibacterales bacterium]|nr:SRPBCC domain-containing protein [Vicinamibacterales bacterium]